MAIITDITQQKRNKERYNIYIDYEYAFSLSGELLIEYKIKKNTEIDEVKIRELVDRENVKKAYSMALHYLQYRMRSQREIEDYLLGKGFDGETIEEIIVKLEEYDFINDQAFAQALTRDLLAGRLVGRRYIVHKLREKGIDRNIIDSIIYDIDDELEYERAFKLAEDEFSRLRQSPTVKDEQRIGRLMGRRGFEWHMINRALREGRENNENI